MRLAVGCACGYMLEGDVLVPRANPRISLIASCGSQVRVTGWLEGQEAVSPPAGAPAAPGAEEREAPISLRS